MSSYLAPSLPGIQEAATAWALESWGYRAQRQGVIECLERQTGFGTIPFVNSTALSRVPGLHSWVTLEWGYSFVNQYWKVYAKCESRNE